MMTNTDTIQNGENEEMISSDEVHAPDELTTTRKERDEYLEGWRREKADFINYKKEESARLAYIAKFGNEELVRDLLQVLDSFELSLTALEKQGPVEKGVYMIKGQLEDILRRKGLERISVSVGDEFDPRIHEAVSSIETEGRAGTVAEEVEGGYALQGKVIRAARVKIVK